MRAIIPGVLPLAIDAWEAHFRELISNSFEHCVISNSLDKSQDDDITFLKLPELEGARDELWQDFFRAPDLPKDFSEVVLNDTSDDEGSACT